LNFFACFADFTERRALAFAIAILALVQIGGTYMTRRAAKTKGRRRAPTLCPRDQAITPGGELPSDPEPPKVVLGAGG
jgi:hypothetical protein